MSLEGLWELGGGFDQSEFSTNTNMTSDNSTQLREHDDDHDEMREILKMKLEGIYTYIYILQFRSVVVNVIHSQLTELRQY